MTSNLAGIIIPIPGSLVPVVLVLGAIAIVFSIVGKINSTAKNMRKGPIEPKAGPYTIDPDQDCRGSGG